MQDRFISRYVKGPHQFQLQKDGAKIFMSNLISDKFRALVKEGFDENNNLCFMASWRFFFRFFEVVYCISAVIAIQCLTVAVLGDFFLTHIAKGLEILSLLFWLQALSILLMVPSNLLTYRACLFSMPFFCEIKRNKPDLVGQGYARWIKKMNWLFCCGRTQKLQYHEYLLRRNRDADKLLLQSYWLKIPALLFLAGTQFFRQIFNSAYQMPQFYIPTLFLLEA